MMGLSKLTAALAAATSLFASIALAAPTPPSASDLTKAPLIQDASLSPDGKHLVAITSPDGDVLDLTVWRTDALAAQPVKIRSEHMRFVGVRFLKNDRLLVTVVQPITIEGTAEHVIKHYVTDLDGKTFSPLLPERPDTSAHTGQSNDQLFDAQLIAPLPQDPRHVLVADDRPDGDGDIYSVDVYSMSAGRLMQGSEKYFDYQTDLKGELRARQYADFDGGKIFIAQQIRDPDSGEWIELFRSYAKDRSLTTIIGFTADPHVILISSPEGNDKTGIYEYDVKQRKVIEPAFEHKLFEAEPAVITSKATADFGRPLGFYYDAETARTYWLDGRMAAISKAASQALGVAAVNVDWTDPGTGVKATIAVESGASVGIESWSDDLKYVLLEKSGPRQPPEYYILADGKLSLLGKARPWIDTATLGDTTLVEYPARDGLMIPAFLTLPPASAGPGPYPTLIEPHGGPWARDDMEWDLAGWIQYFASRGYAVLQPQFRGSEGWGQKLWRAGDGEWGQKMQDDNDDAVKWLIGRKIADPGRVAIFGYSYGGYAALAASIRPNGLYQCAISGAGAGDLAAIAEATFDNRFQREFQHPTIDGLDALAHAREAKIPVLLYHGDRDQTVDIEQSRKFAAALRGAGKPVKLVEIKDMGHQYTFMTPAMMEQQLDVIDSFLKTDCKPGGL
jgi:dipeptidyl aminopeptidase/acylaminoacyl peptidase